MILVTGANGFVGKHLCSFLTGRGKQVRAAVRSKSRVVDGAELSVVGNIDGETQWSQALDGVDAVVHLAARAHILKDETLDPLADFRKVNVDGTRALVEQSMAAGVAHFIYISSAKAASSRTLEPVRESDSAIPSDPYGQSKHEAEQLVLEMTGKSSMRGTIIRPPLVYGPGVGANFLRLLKVVEHGIPLPFKKIENRRSLVSVDNLCDFIDTCIGDPRAAGEVFNVSDGQDVSIAELLDAIGEQMDREPRMFYLPQPLMRLGFRLIGMSEDFDRLCGSLQIDIEKSKELLGWTPPVSMSEALEPTVASYRSANSKSRGI